MSNLVTLCGAHHRALHEGALLVEGRSGKLVFRHADGTPYGTPPSGLVDPTQPRALRALRALGFAEKDVRLALRQTLVELAPDATNQLELVLRHSLQLLTERAWQRAS